MKSRPWFLWLAAAAAIPVLAGCVVVVGKDVPGIEDEGETVVFDEDGTEFVTDERSDAAFVGETSPALARDARVIGSTENIGPFSDAILAGSHLFVSGNIARDPDTGEIVRGDIRRSTRLVLDQIGDVLRQAGLGYGDVVKATVFLADMADYDAMNEVYREYFPVSPPARSCVEVARLARDADVEIEVIAVRP
jgi:2-iminobutanoate/2-iminopropanoate deaminase